MVADSAVGFVTRPLGRAIATTPVPIAIFKALSDTGRVLLHGNGSGGGGGDRVDVADWGGRIVRHCYGMFLLCKSNICDVV